MNSLEVWIIYINSYIVCLFCLFFDISTVLSNLMPNPKYILVSK